MAITVDWITKTFSVPQADLTLVSGTLFDLNTETQFRQPVNAIMAGEEGIVFEDPMRHFTQVTISGVTYARLIEVINGYNVTFTPNTQWTARLQGSNNNIFDVQGGVLNQNQVQVIPNNSAGLINADISEQTVEGTRTVRGALRLILSALAGKLSGAATTTVTIRDADDTKNRITATVDADGNRTAVTLDDT